MEKPNLEAPKYPSQMLPRVTMSCAPEDYRHLERIERYLQQGRGSLKRIPYAALFRAALRAAPLDERLLEAYDQVIAHDHRYKRVNGGRRAKG
jgi:hypothetical protein